MGKLQKTESNWILDYSSFTAFSGVNYLIDGFYSIRLIRCLNNFIIPPMKSEDFLNFLFYYIQLFQVQLLLDQTDITQF